MYFKKRYDDQDLEMLETYKECVPWVSQHLDQCVMTSLQLAGVYCGIAATVTWLIALITLLQIRFRKYHNSSRSEFTYKMVHQALADVTNLIGSVLGQQLGIQVVFATLLVVMDAVLFIQCVLFKLFFKWKYKSPVLDFTGGGKKKKKGLFSYMLLSPWAFAFSMLMFRSAVTGQLSTDESMSQSNTVHYPGRLLLSYDVQEPTQEEVENEMSLTLGYVMGVLSTVFYVTGILPTILKVYQDRPFSSLHPLFYTLCSIGNILYIIGVYSQDHSVHFFLHTFPWILARAFLLFTEVSIMIQLLLSARRRKTGRPIKDEVVSLLRNESQDDNEDGDTLGSGLPAEARNHRNNRRGSVTSYEESDHIDQLCEPILRQGDIMEDLRFAGDVSQTNTLSSVDSLEQLGEESGNQEDLTEEQIFEILAAEDAKRAAQEKAGVDPNDALIPISLTDDGYVFDQKTTFVISTEKKPLEWHSGVQVLKPQRQTSSSSDKWLTMDKFE